MDELFTDSLDLDPQINKFDLLFTIFIFPNDIFYQHTKKKLKNTKTNTKCY